jgi:NADH-quinone oxidoreductase subunit N
VSAGPEIPALAPALLVALAALGLPLVEVTLARRGALLGRALTRARRGTYLAFLAAFALLAALLLLLAASGEPAPPEALVACDAVASFLGAGVLIAALLVVLASSQYLADVRANHGEYYALVLASVVGMLLLCAAVHLVMLVIAAELASLPIAALVVLRRDALRAHEAALKYFATSALASGALLYGTALLYGATGELALREIGVALDPENPLALSGAGLVLAGLAFKVGSVPFHQWLPDTSEGAPTPLAAWLSTGLRIAGFAALIRVLQLALQPASDLLYAPLWAMAAASMLLGNLMALVQTGARRMLAWAAVAQAGYALLGLLVGGPEGVAAVLFFLLALSFPMLGAFAAVGVLARGGRDRDRLDELAGLARAQPFVASALAVCALALLGVPGTAGFAARFGLVSAAVARALATGDGWLLALAVIALLGALLTAVYVLRLGLALFARAPLPGAELGGAGTFDRVVLAVCALASLALGLAPHDALALLVPGVDLVRLAQVAAAALH